MRTRGHNYDLDSPMADADAAVPAPHKRQSAAAVGHKHPRDAAAAFENGDVSGSEPPALEEDTSDGVGYAEGGHANSSRRYTPQQRALGVLCWHESGHHPKRAVELFRSQWHAEWGALPTGHSIDANMRRWSKHFLESGHLFNTPPQAVNHPMAGYVIRGRASTPSEDPTPSSTSEPSPQQAATEIDEQRRALAERSRLQCEAQAALEREHAALQAAAREVGERLEAQRAAAAALATQALALQLQRAAVEEGQRRLEARERELEGHAQADGAAHGQPTPPVTADPDTPAAAGASLPPPPAGQCMEGPSDAYWFVEVTPEPLEIQRYSDMVADPGAGAVASFVGVTRDTFQGKRVLRLEYEAYIPMALAKLKDLCLQLRRRWDVRRVAVAHRVGVVEVCEASVAIVASSPHRKDALEAVHWAIDELKASVPIWKKEFFTDGSQWKENAEARRLMAAVERAEGRAAAGGLPA